MTTILQVDDDPNDVLFLQRAMHKVGVANLIQTVSDGRQAIDYLRGAGKFADREEYPFPGLVLLDLKLPYVMGLDVLKWIRAHIQTPLVVIILSASAENADIAAAYRLGVNAFLVKPSEVNKLQAMVKAIKDFWLTHNALPLESYREPAALPAPAGTPAPNGKPARSAADTPAKDPPPVLAQQETPFGGVEFAEEHLKRYHNTLSLFAGDTDPETAG